MKNTANITPAVTLLSITPEAEKIIERAGRTAYQSFERMKEGSEKSFIAMLIRRGHESVLEHAWASFLIQGVSRALTHQLVRHRLASYTQKSQRYVDEKKFTFVTPPSISGSTETAAIFREFMEHAREVYALLQEKGIPKQDARYVLPNAVTTEIVVTANFREWRHILALRGAPDAQWEIRRVALEIFRILQKHAPSCFQDFEIDESRQCLLRRSLA